MRPFRLVLHVWKCNLVSCSDVTSDLQLELLTSFCCSWYYFRTYRADIQCLLICNVQLKKKVKYYSCDLTLKVQSSSRGSVHELILSGYIVGCRSTDKNFGFHHLDLMATSQGILSIAFAAKILTRFPGSDVIISDIIIRVDSTSNRGLMYGEDSNSKRVTM